MNACAAVLAVCVYTVDTNTHTRTPYTQSSVLVYFVECNNNNISFACFALVSIGCETWLCAHRHSAASTLTHSCSLLFARTRIVPFQQIDSDDDSSVQFAKCISCMQGSSGWHGRRSPRQTSLCANEKNSLQCKAHTHTMHTRASTAASPSTEETESRIMSFHEIKMQSSIRHTARASHAIQKSSFVSIGVEPLSTTHTHRRRHRQRHRSRGPIPNARIFTFIYIYGRCRHRHTHTHTEASAR